MARPRQTCLSSCLQVVKLSGTSLLTVHKTQQVMMNCDILLCRGTPKPVPTLQVCLGIHDTRAPTPMSPPLNSSSFYIQIKPSQLNLTSPIAPVLLRSSSFSADSLLLSRDHISPHPFLREDPSWFSVFAFVIAHQAGAHTDPGALSSRADSHPEE